MNKIKLMPILLFLIGCASYEPVVDTYSLSEDEYNRYHRDIAECRHIAEHSTIGEEGVIVSTAGGAAIGAGTGALIGTIFGDTVEGLALGAVVGGLEGFLNGVCHADHEYEYIYRNCLAGRGYHVLN